MQIVLAARPLPRILYFVSAILQINVAAGLIYVYVVMRRITSSSERFEIIPNYFMAILLCICGIFSLFSTKAKFPNDRNQISCGIGIFAGAVMLCVVSLVCTVWLTAINDNFSVCTFDRNRRMCQCRLNATTYLARDDWYSFENVAGCHKLDHLIRCMTAVALLLVAGLFLASINLANYSLTLRALKRRARPPSQSWAHWATAHGPAPPALRCHHADDHFATSGTPPPPPLYDELNCDDGRRTRCHSLSAPPSEGAPPPYKK